MIDHALLHPTLTDRKMEDGCQLAAEYQVGAVCVKPYFVKRAAELLQGKGVAVCTVIAFPHGGSTLEVKRREAEIACQQGATELDLVVNIGKALGGDMQYVEDEIRAINDIARRNHALLKVIIETDLLPDDDLKVQLSEAAENAGADFVKTSTGFGFVRGIDGKFGVRGATEHDIRLIRNSVSSRIQVKASGGVRCLHDLIALRDLGATRCGTSATKAILDEYRRIGQAGEPNRDPGSLQTGY